MKPKRLYSLISLILGVILIVNSRTSITGAFVGEVGIVSLIKLFLGMVLLLVGGVLFFKDRDLEDEIEEFHWRKYHVTPESTLEDVEQEYLQKKGSKKRRTLSQGTIERRVTGGRFIDDDSLNKKSTYEEQFYEGYAAQGGRVIDVESHIAKKGEYKGKLVHFGQPANARYLWIVDEDGNFILANRQTMRHDMPQMSKEKIDLEHRRHKLPHATMARGKRVYGSGEVLVEGGRVKSFNTASGHYIDLEDVSGFNEQGREVFLYFMKKSGWEEVRGGAKYTKRSRG